MSREIIQTALCSDKPAQELEKLQGEGSLASYLPEIQAMVGFGGGGSGHKDLWWHTKLVVSQCPLDSLVRWAALFHDAGKVKTFSWDEGKVTFHQHEAVSARLFNRAARRLGGFPSDDREIVWFLVRYLGHVEGYDSTWTDSAVRRLAKTVWPHFNRLAALARADTTSKHQSKRQAHQDRVGELAARVRDLEAQDSTPPALPSGLGNVLMAELGLVPGKALGQIMRALREAVEQGKLPRQAEPDVYLAWITRSGVHKP